MKSLNSWYEDNIRYTWIGWKLNKLKTIYYSIIYGFRNLWYWRKTIWANRAWDYCFIFDILEHQLAQMEECIRSGYNIKADEVADEIKLARFALHRLCQDEYMLQENTVFTNKEKYKTKINGLPFDQYMRNQDLRYLFNIMNKYLLGWWD